LAGRFDAAASQQLVAFLKAYGEGASSVFIHTSNINQIDISATDIFRSALYSLNSHFSAKLIFTGKDAASIAPKNSQIV
jgi:hypothetical protein